jgi:AsmA-like C-terminal region
MRSKVVKWAAVAIGAFLIVIAVVAMWALRSEPLRKLVIATLADRLDSEVELGAFKVDLFPTPAVRGERLVLRHRGRRDVPPLIEISSFSAHAGIADVLRRPRRFRQVTLEGLVINIPPGGLRLAGKGQSGEADARSVADPGRSPIIVEELQADGAVLRIIPRREGKEPREFAIRELHMRSLGVAQQMPFTAELTNPLPKGLIQTSGTFGPWQKRDPGSTPLAGHYTFAKADLDTIKGIGGLLDSAGDFGGRLDRITVRGETRTPDFHLDISKQPMPLTTRFDAVVDGTDGDTYLHNIDAELQSTKLNAKGAVTGTKGVKGRTIQMHVKIDDGRIEDLLRLSVNAGKPLMVGRVALHADLTLPPGEKDVVDKLALSGAFDVSAAQFTDRGVQQKLSGMSHRARGRDADEQPDNVVSDLTGRFTLKNGLLSFSRLSFSMPGATVRLRGSYGLKTEALAFDGTLTMQATISQAAGGGLKSVFLKIVDPLFRKEGAGAVLPIRVRGTRRHPEFGLDVGRVVRRK